MDNNIKSNHLSEEKRHVGGVAPAWPRGYGGRRMKIFSSIVVLILLVGLAPSLIADMAPAPVSAETAYRIETYDLGVPANTEGMYKGTFFEPNFSSGKLWTQLCVNSTDTIENKLAFNNMSYRFANHIDVTPLITSNVDYDWQVQIPTISLNTLPALTDEVMTREIACRLITPTFTSYDETQYTLTYKLQLAVYDNGSEVAAGPITGPYYLLIAKSIKFNLIYNYDLFFTLRGEMSIPSKAYPTITAKDFSLNVGDAFPSDQKRGVTAKSGATNTVFPDSRNDSGGLVDGSSKYNGEIRRTGGDAIPTSSNKLTQIGIYSQTFTANDYSDYTVSDAASREVRVSTSATPKLEVTYPDGGSYKGEWTNQKLTATVGMNSISAKSGVSPEIYVGSEYYGSPKTFNSNTPTGGTGLNGVLRSGNVELSAKSATQTIKIDKDNPTAGATYNESAVKFTDTSSDGLSGIDRSKSKIAIVPANSGDPDNGAYEPFAKDGANYTYTPSFKYGRYDIYISATDNAGNTNTKKILADLIIKSDTGKPSISGVVDGKAHGSNVWTNKDVTVRVTRDDSIGDSDKYLQARLKSNNKVMGSGAYADGAAYTHKDETNGSGVAYYGVLSNDANGDTELSLHSDDYVVKVDKTPPAAATQYGGGKFTDTSSDSLSGIDRSKNKIAIVPANSGDPDNGAYKPFAKDGANYTYTPNLKYGCYDIYVSATDIAGNTNTKKTLTGLVIKSDTGKPSISGVVDGKAHGSNVWTNKDVSVRVTRDDSIGDSDKYLQARLKSNNKVMGSGAYASGAAYTHNTETNGSGVAYYGVLSNDASGDTELSAHSDDYVVKVDKTPPAAATQYGGGKFTDTSSDSLSGIDHSKNKIAIVPANSGDPDNGAYYPFAKDGANYTYTPNLKYGSYDIYVTATDIAGNTNTKKALADLIIKSDTGKPSISGVVNGKAHGSNVWTNKDVTVRVTRDDSIGDSDKYLQARLKGNNKVMGSGAYAEGAAYTHKDETNGSGVAYYGVLSNDANGDTELSAHSDDYVVKVDKTPPAAAAKYDDEKFTDTSSDSLSGIDRSKTMIAIVPVDAKPTEPDYTAFDNDSNPGAFTHTPNKPRGKYDVYIIACDMVGNRSAGTKILTGQLITSPEKTPVNITGITAEKVYDGNSAFTADKISLADTVLTGKLSYDDVYVVKTASTSGTTAGPDVGAGKALSVTGLALAGTDADEYIVVGGAMGTAKITPKTVDVIAAAADKAYDGNGTFHISSLSLDTDTIADSDLADIAGGKPKIEINGVSATATLLSGETVDANESIPKKVGIKGFTLTGEKAGDYVLSSQAVLTTAYIHKKELYIVGVTAEKTYDRTTGFTANQIVLPPLFPMLVAGDDVVFDTSGVTGSVADKNVDSAKELTVHGLSLIGQRKDNYKIISVIATATITPKELTITGTTVTKVYDNNPLFNTADIKLGDLQGLIGGDEVTVEKTNETVGSVADNEREVGEGKQLTVSGLSLTGSDRNNYMVGTVTGAATITKRPITVTNVNAAKAYDGDAYFVAEEIGVTEASIQNSATGDKLYIEKTTGAEGTADDASAGDHPFDATGLELYGDAAHNYSFDGTANGTATISLSDALHVNPDDTAVEYDGQPHCAKCATITSAPGIADAKLYYCGSEKEETWSEEPPSYTDAGVYLVRVKAKAPNYEDSPVAAETVSVLSRPIEVKPVDKTKSYDGTALKADAVELTGASESLLQGHALDISKAVFTGAVTNPGTVESNVSGVGVSGTAASNYSISGKPGKLTITGSIPIAGPEETPIYKAPATTTARRAPIVISEKTPIYIALATTAEGIEAPVDRAPDTGDPAEATFWICLIIIAAAGLFIFLTLLRRERFLKTTRK